MLKVYLMLVLSAASAVFAESVRETETWVPLKNKSPHEDLESSGDSSHEDFEFSPNPVGDKNGFEDDDDDEDDDDVDDYDDLSGSGSSEIPTTEDIFNNWIPDPEGPFAPRPTIDEKILVENNEVGLRNSPNRDHGQPSNVLMTVAEEESLFSNTEVLAAVIAGAAVGLVFAILLIVLLVHFVLRIKKKDEGSYDLGKTPIYKKAPTAEIYA